MIPDSIPTAEAPPRRATLRIEGDLLIKKQTSDRCRTEHDRTQLGSRIAADCGLFDVPDIVFCDQAKGEIAFRFVPDAIPLHTRLSRRPERALMSRAGRALAVIHDAGDNSTATDVTWHGDYGMWNLLWSDARDTIVVTDWANADWTGLPHYQTRGNAGLDIGIALISLFHHRASGPGYIQAPEALGWSFLSAYIEERGPLAPEVHPFVLQLLRPWWKLLHGQRSLFQAIAHYPSLIRLYRFTSNMRSRLEPA